LLFFINVKNFLKDLKENKTTPTRPGEREESHSGVQSYNPPSDAPVVPASQIIGSNNLILAGNTVGEVNVKVEHHHPCPKCAKLASPAHKFCTGCGNQLKQ